MSSPINGDSDEKNVAPSVDISTQVCRKKSSGSSARKRCKSQSESASSKAKNISESSESENRSRQETPPVNHPPPRKAKPSGKYGIRKRNSKRVAERVLACMQKRQKKMVASDSDSVINDAPCFSDMKLSSNSSKEKEDIGSSLHKNVKPLTTSRSRRKKSPVKDSHKVVQDEFPSVSLNEMTPDLPATSSDDNLKKEECVDENTCKQEVSDDKSWKTIEKALFEKGLEIFGRKR